MTSAREDQENTGAEGKFAQLRENASALNITLQQKFWLWFYTNLKKFLNKDTSEFYDTMLSSNPNPLSSPAMAQTSGILAIIGRALRLFIVPLQKILQYHEWLNAPEGSEAKKNKPTFTLEDAFYLGLDIALLALTAAAFFSGASIPGAAIALTAAGISFAVAAYHYGKYWYEGYKLKKEKQYVDDLLEKITANPDHELNENDKTYIETRRQQLGCEANTPMLDILNQQSATLGQRIKESISSRYQNVKKTLGFGLTMLAIVSGSLILAGLMLGPVGLPLIAAGAALSITTLIIAGAMVITDWVKQSRDDKQKKIAKRDLEAEPLLQDEPAQKPKQGVQLTASSFRQRKAAAKAKVAEEANDIEMTHFVTPPVQTDSSVVKSSIFNRGVKTSEPVAEEKPKPEKP